MRPWRSSTVNSGGPSLRPASGFRPASASLQLFGEPPLYPACAASAPQGTQPFRWGCRQRLARVVQAEACWKSARRQPAVEEHGHGTFGTRPRRWKPATTRQPSAGSRPSGSGPTARAMRESGAPGAAPGQREKCARRRPRRRPIGACRRGNSTSGVGNSARAVIARVPAVATRGSGPRHPDMPPDSCGIPSASVPIKGSQ